MNPVRTAAARALLPALVCALLLAGCGSAGSTPPGEPPVIPGASPGKPAQSVTVALWFPDRVTYQLFPEERQLPQAEPAALANAAVHELLAGPTAPYLGRAIPQRIELLEPVTVQGGVARVNLSEERWPDFNAPEFDSTLYGLIQTLTYLPGIDKVMLEVQGKPLLAHPYGRGRSRFVLTPSPGREEWVQQRVEKGLDPWRQDPAQVLRWEGRAFGYDLAELEAAHPAVVGEGDQAVATGLAGNVTDSPNQIILVRQRTPGGKSYWSVRECRAAEGTPALVK